MDNSIIHIIAACRKQDRKAQKTLFEMYNGDLYAVAYNYMNDAHEAQEILQRSWIEIFGSLKNYTEQDALVGWMKTIVIRQAWKELRNRTEIVEIDPKLVDPRINDEKRLVEKLTCEEILREMDAIPNMSRMVFKMYVLDQWSHAEIAQELGIKESTSRAHLTKARKIMKERFYSIDKMVKNEI